LNTVGYANLVKKFCEHTKKTYNEGQMKNIWAFLKKVYPMEDIEHEINWIGNGSNNWMYRGKSYLVEGTK
jgi:hypothetical protein